MTDWVGQARALVEIGLKVSFTFFLASLCVILIDHFSPNLFDGLHQSVIPAIRVAAVMSGVIFVTTLMASIGRIITDKLSIAWQHAKDIVHIRKVKSNLNDVDLNEVATISLIMASGSRFTRLNADNLTVISLQKKGVLIHCPSDFAIGDGASQFMISEDVWVHLHSLREFHLLEPQRVKSTLESNFVELEKLRVLPQNHPKVIDRIKSIKG